MNMGEENFKSSFRRYRKKVRLDFYDATNRLGNGDCAFLIRRAHHLEKGPELFGVKNVQEWKICDVSTHPGLVVIKNSLTNTGQRYWITRCLRDFPKKPNRRNVDIDKVLVEVDNVWDYSINNGFKIIDKLRWATLGYHHNWDTKIYSEDRRGVFPADLAAMCQHFAAALGYPEFKAEAAIVNMYHPGSSLSGHVDQSEVDLEAPLLSFSFGQPAVFLIGGTSLEDPATPLLLESGDVMVMSGASRLCYHAVPCILKSDRRPWEFNETANDISAVDSAFCSNVISLACDKVAWQPFDKYVSRSRINLNVRQVLPARCQTLEEANVVGN